LSGGSPRIVKKSAGRSRVACPGQLLADQRDNQAHDGREERHRGLPDVRGFLFPQAGAKELAPAPFAFHGNDARIEKGKLTPGEIHGSKQERGNPAVANDLGELLGQPVEQSP
jgi:hypothetical protein